MTGPDTDPDRPPGSRWTLTVDPARCIGTAVCIGTAPHLLELHAGRARPRTSSVRADDTLLDLVDACPTNAITVATAPPVPEG